MLSCACVTFCRRAKAAWEAYYEEQLQVLKQARHCIACTCAGLKLRLTLEGMSCRSD